MADVTFTVDGKKLTAPAGTLLIEACRAASIAIPQFCYYPGLSLQAACRMCLVRLEKVPKLQTACTTPVAEGMVVTPKATRSPRRAKPPSSCCWAIIPSTARSAMPAASANCRT
jgi:NADH dehydrogenase/NADH:ubiquinone oxidoreductase subunit G